MSHSLSLSNGDLTVVNMDVPSLRPEWSMVRATEGPWPVKRYDKALVKEMVAKVSLLATACLDSVLCICSAADKTQRGNQRLRQW